MIIQSTPPHDPCHPTSDREFAVWENGRLQGHHEARRQPFDRATVERIADALISADWIKWPLWEVWRGTTEEQPSRADLVAAILAAAESR